MTDPKDFSAMDYRAFDRPEVTGLLFHPRPAITPAPARENVTDMLIPVAEKIVVSARFHSAGEKAPTILFFHGNGEIVADYDDIAPLYNQLGLGFFAADYRGYGRSTGRPSVSAMMDDCHRIFAYAQKALAKNEFTGPLIVMGRSLGSASALELARHYPAHIDALIIESGFAHAIPLLDRLGIDTRELGLKEEAGFGNIDKIRRFDKPTLIIHAQFDHIIPFDEAKALYRASGATEKTLLQIPEADHNTVFFHGLKPYLKAVQGLARKLPA